MPIGVEDHFRFKSKFSNDRQGYRMISEGIKWSPGCAHRRRRDVLVRSSPLFLCKITILVNNPSITGMIHSRTLVEESPTDVRLTHSVNSPTMALSYDGIVQRRHSPTTRTSTHRPHRSPTLFSRIQRVYIFVLSELFRQVESIWLPDLVTRSDYPIW